MNCTDKTNHVIQKPILMLHFTININGNLNSMNKSHFLHPSEKRVYYAIPLGDYHFLALVRVGIAPNLFDLKKTTMMIISSPITPISSLLLFKAERFKLIIECENEMRRILVMKRHYLPNPIDANEEITLSLDPALYGSCVWIGFNSNM